MDYDVMRIMKSLDSVRFQKHVDTLTCEQKNFVDLLQDWTRNPRNMVVIVSGPPGTGKTYSVIETLDKIECRQARMAPSGRAAQKINGSTIHSRFRLGFREGSTLKECERIAAETIDDINDCIEKTGVLRKVMLSLDPEVRIVVVDEVGMVPFFFIFQIIEKVFEDSKLPILFVVMGDRYQLRPVGSTQNIFDIYKLLCDRFEAHFIELTESKRFDEEYSKFVTALKQFVINEDEEGLFSFVCQNYPVKDSIDSEDLLKCDKILAFKNVVVENYNQFYLKRMLEGPIVRLYSFNGGKTCKNKFVDVKANCLIYTTENGFNLKNGTPLFFEKYDPENDVIKCRTEKDNYPVTISRNFIGDFPITVGFAATVHKFQGDTIDGKIAINFCDGRNLNLAYTALSRIKSLNQIVAIQL